MNAALLQNQLEGLLESSINEVSDELPSNWYERTRIMKTDDGPFPGPFRFSRTPYCLEMLNCLSPNHPAKIIAVMKGAQVGFSAGVIEPGIGYIIDQVQGPSLYTVGSPEILPRATNRIDRMIDGCDLRKFISSTIKRKRNQKTGDTNKMKEFAGGFLAIGSATNAGLFRQDAYRYAFIDDYDNVPPSFSKDGNIQKLIEQRAAAYHAIMKYFFISTPALKQTSNIEAIYQKGDQRKYHVPCPCCGDFIALEWSVDIIGTDGKQKGGINWKLDDKGKLIPESVGYICQSCGDWFDDSRKAELLQAGYWKPTATPINDTTYSYHLSSLYAPPGMKAWVNYVEDYLEANPANQPQNASLQQTFVNLGLGQTYEAVSVAPKANDLAKNTRNYLPGIVPERLSEQDGNGRIVMLTMGADLNGLIEDARLDYEIVAWAESGASYSVLHGSIGTFIPRENTLVNKKDRFRWTYEMPAERSVWPEFENLMAQKFVVEQSDGGTREVSVMYTLLDVGYATNHAWAFVNGVSNHLISGIQGEETDKPQVNTFGVDRAIYRKGRKYPNYYRLDVNQIKDQLAALMKLKFNSNFSTEQPKGFMNFPQPHGGLYQHNNFFSHFESEVRKTKANASGVGVGYIWEKKTSVVQNHLWDCRVYNMAARKIFIDSFFKEAKEKNTNPSWEDFVEKVMG